MNNIFKKISLKQDISILLILTIVLNYSYLSADDNVDSKLRDMSLDELLQVKIAVASKFEQSLADSPGIVTTYTAKEITLFGGRDLGEVLSRIPGFEEFPSLYNGRNIITMRGDQPSINNNHVLILLNGIPFNRESYAGGLWNEAMILTIPLASIQQLEVIRGPGSVLYGTNAFAGVVNIITKSSDQLKSDTSIGTGTFSTEQLNLNLSGSSGNWQWTSAMRWFDTDGWPYESLDTNGQIFRDDITSRSPGIIATIANKGFKADIYWGKAKQLTIRGTSTEPQAGQTDNEKYSVNLSYVTPLTEKWNLTTNFSYVAGRTDHGITSAVPGELNFIRYETDDYRFELMSQNKLSNNSNLLFGGTIDNFRGKTPPPFVLIDGWNNSLYSIYAQYELQYSKTKYILGAQYNKAEKSFDSLVPRLGIIHHINDTSSIKLLYGQAFRTPSTVERLINVSIPTLSLKGDINLNPETVTNWDLQYLYNEKQL